MRAIRSGSMRGKHAAFCHAALAAPIAVVTERARIHPVPEIEPIEFVALSVAHYVELGGRPPKKPADPEELKHDLDCGYVKGNVNGGKVYLVHVPRAQPIVLISEKRYRTLAGSPGPNEMVAL